MPENSIIPFEQKDIQKPATTTVPDLGSAFDVNPDLKKVSIKIVQEMQDGSKTTDHFGARREGNGIASYHFKKQKKS